MNFLGRVHASVVAFLLIGALTVFSAHGHAQKSWGPLTSGPFYTGTADANPPQSGYVEPFFFDSVSSSLGQSQISMPQRVSYGIVNNLEIDFYVPIDYNRVGPPSTSNGQTVTASGMGNLHFELKKQFMKDGNDFRFWARPSLALTYIQFIPTGKYKNLNPALYGADQNGSGTYNEGLNLLARKRFKPFEGYFQFGDLVENPNHVGSGYTYNNGFTTVPNGEQLRVVNGNLLYYAGAFEDVLNSKHGLGYLIEYNGESQSKTNLLFGHANAPSWTFLHISPEAEYTWPNNKSFAITWGGGITLSAAESGYIRSKTPMFTVSFYRNGKHGYRGEGD